MSVRLRVAVPADFPAVVRLMNVAYRGSGPGASWNTESTFLAGNRTSEALLREELSANPAAALLVIDDPEDAAMKGCVFLEPVLGGVWYLGSLTVEPRLQAQGLGRQLLHAAEQWVAQQGARTIRMKVIHVRDTLIAWYLRRGYLLTGETHPFPYGDDRFGIPLRDDLTFVVLEKRLAR